MNSYYNQLSEKFRKIWKSFYFHKTKLVKQLSEQKTRRVRNIAQVSEAKAITSAKTFRKTHRSNHKEHKKNEKKKINDRE